MKSFSIIRLLASLGVLSRPEKEDFLERQRAHHMDAVDPNYLLKEETLSSNEM